jgi:phosphatidylserine decarboxylase
MKSLQDWIKEDVPKLKKESPEEYYGETFHRDPIRTNFIDPSCFYSPADGTILYIKEVGPDDPIIEVKGSLFTLKNLMMQEVGFRALVIGIFLSQFDVHIARLPFPGIGRYRRLDKIETKNRPMLANENDILAGIIDHDNSDYAFTNERFIDTISCPSIGYQYHLVSIADNDVDVIAHHFDQGKILHQNQRIATIKWGSQIDLILPLPTPFEYEILAKEGFHVEAGIDTLIKMKDEEKVKA